MEGGDAGRVRVKGRAARQGNSGWREGRARVPAVVAVVRRGAKAPLLGRRTEPSIAWISAARAALLVQMAPSMHTVSMVSILGEIISPVSKSMTVPTHVWTVAEMVGVDPELTANKPVKPVRIEAKRSSPGNLSPESST